MIITSCYRLEVVGLHLSFGGSFKNLTRKTVELFLQSYWWQKYKNETGVKITAKNTLKIAALKLFSSEAASQLRKKKYKIIKFIRIQRKKKAKHFFSKILFILS